MSVLVANLTAAALALSGQPAPPVEVGHVGLGASLEALVTGPDGGAWVLINRTVEALARGKYSPADEIGRATPDHRFRVVPAGGRVGGAGGVVGPDGQAWFVGGTSLVRSDAAGNVTRREFPQPLGDVAAMGPDGTLWAADPQAGTLSRVDAQGAVTRASLPRSACAPRLSPAFADMKAAADGAVWIADEGCHRLIRIAPGAAPVTFALDADEQSVALAPDRVGGMWFIRTGQRAAVGHADAAGTIRRWPTPERYRPATGIAVGPDGTAHLAFGRCVLGRLAPGGTLSFGPAPIPVEKLAFDPSGGMWLASTTRLVHAPSASLSRGGCDETPPAIKLTPALRGPVRLAQLRRGVRITVREPATISAEADYGDDDHDSRLRIVRAKTGGTLVFHLPKAQIKRYERAVAAGREAYLSLYVEASDRDGNIARAEQEALPVIR